MVVRRIMLVTVGSLALWGCGSDGDPDVAPAPTVADNSLPTEPDSDETDTDGVDADVEVEIVISDFAFSGGQDIAVGQRVVVTNTDSASHTWSAVDGSFDSGTLGEGDSFEFTFDEPGTFDYLCNIHPTMTGSVTVTG